LRGSVGEKDLASAFASVPEPSALTPLEIFATGLILRIRRQRP
jgi:hypothetical protein